MVPDFELKFSIRMGTFGVFLNVEFSRGNVGLNESGGDFFREVEEVLEFFETVKAVMNADVDSSEGLHGVVADS